MMVSYTKPTPLLVLYLLILCIATSFKSCYSIGQKSIIFCPKIERNALTGLKKSLEDPSDLLSSWNTTREANCCKWHGVVCSNVTGNVHQLHLQGDGWPSSLQGRVNPSLLNFKHLRYLDLSQNSFDQIFPSFIGSLANLEYLNLSYTGFHGRIPHSIGNLSNLRVLSLEDYSPRFVDSLEWLSGLSKIESLNMNNVNLSRAANWAEVINTLPSLVELRFRSCGLSFIPALIDVSVGTSLAILDLSGNLFKSLPIPSWIFQLTNLTFLDLSYNSFDGPIPKLSKITKLEFINLSGNKINSSIPDWLYLCNDLEIVIMKDCFLQNTISNAVANLTSLNTLDLSSNELSGEIPREIATLCKMQILDLSDNRLRGDISNSFGNMSDCFLRALESLRLGENRISGQLTNQFGEFDNLIILELEENSLSGAIPANLGNSSRLTRLTLGRNKLTGNLPESMGQLVDLDYLDVQDNMLQGVVTESHFSNLTNLRYLHGSRNNLILKVNPKWIPPFTLTTLELGSWDLGAGSPIPPWLETQKNVLELDLSNTGITGHVPTWLWEIQILNISHNHLYGRVPDITGPEGGPRLLYLSSNQFSGLLPRVGNVVTELDLSNNSFSGGLSRLLCDMANETYRLEILHLEGNHLTGELPDCFMKWPSLRVLNLGNNDMSGSIPNSVGLLAQLLSFNLPNNRFSGQMPPAMSNCSSLLKIDVADNELDGNIPKWIGTSLTGLRFLILRSNKFSGEIPSSMCNLSALQILDVSDNEVSGVIPRCINNLTAMATKRRLAEFGDGELDYSYYIGVFVESASVATKGSEVEYDRILSLVTNMDMSNNNLSGEIPEELTSLVELRSLNISGNHLTGKIPENIGEMKQLESLDLSRNSLLGEMPNSFAVMSSLNFLNVSYNNLTGTIPESTQIRGMNDSSFTGNDLCGPPLTRKCRPDQQSEDEEDGKSEIEWFYVFLSLGYGVGLSVFFTTLVLKKSWRNAYFGLLECVWDKLYVFAHIQWAKLTQIY